MPTCIIPVRGEGVVVTSENVLTESSRSRRESSTSVDLGFPGGSIGENADPWVSGGPKKVERATGGPKGEATWRHGGQRAVVAARWPAGGGRWWRGQRAVVAARWQHGQGRCHILVKNFNYSPKTIFLPGKTCSEKSLCLFEVIDCGKTLREAGQCWCSDNS